MFLGEHLIVLGRFLLIAFTDKYKPSIIDFKSSINQNIEPMKIRNESIVGLLVAATMLISCDENTIEIAIPKEEETGIAIENEFQGALVADLKTNAIQCHVQIDSLQPYLINNFASHVEIPNFVPNLDHSIFIGQSTEEYGYIYPLSPVVEFIKDELMVNKIIVSWSKDRALALTDSVYSLATQIDSNFRERLKCQIDSYPNSNAVYVNLLNVNRYGYAKLKVADPQINNYLLYKVDPNDTTSNGISISAQDFRDKYGDAFCSSLTLGTLILVEGYVFGIQVLPASQNDILNEITTKVKIYFNEGKAWSELVANSKYLQNSTFMSVHTMIKGCPGMVANYQKLSNMADSLYQTGEFTQFSMGYQHYSALYPHFNFIDVENPY